MRLVGSIMVLITALSVGAYAYLPPVYPGQDRLAQIVLVQNSDEAQEPGRQADVQTPALDSDSTSGSSLLGSIAQAFKIIKLKDDPTLHERSTTLRPSANSSRAPSGSDRVQAPTQRGETKLGVTKVVESRHWRSLITSSRPTTGPLRNEAAPARNDYDARYQLVRDLQAELRRLGCYSGRIDGDWGPRSRYAARSFLRKVNASLPIQKPDYIFLTLVRGHANRVCGITCPSGESLGSNGRCVASVIADRAARTNPSKRTTTNLGVRAQSATTGANVREAMVAKDRVDEAIVVPVPHLAQRPKYTARKKTDVASVARKDLAAVNTASPIVVRRGEPLPGRMSIGAPLPQQAELPAPRALVPPPAPVRAQPSKPTVGQQARLTIYGDSLDVTRPDSRRDQVGKTSPPPQTNPAYRKRAKGVAMQKKRSAKKTSKMQKRWRRSQMVRTSSGKVRRGSPQHNLMLSLGGVF